LAQSSQSLHEDPAKLSDEIQDRHRAIVSIMEELEAVDWYDQRVHGATDQDLAAILAHNRDEEKEHAAMALEWLRRRDPKLDAALRTYLFTEGSVLTIEKKAEAAGNGGAAAARGDGSLGIGSLRGNDK
jgi:uncharacterized protein